MERYNMTRGILKINLDVANVDGFGVKTTEKVGKPGTKVDK